MSKIQNNKFNFFVPATFEKAKDGSGVELVKIKGIANTASAEDSDGETLFPTGFDSTPFLSKGFFNYNHQGSKTSKAICGEPTLAKAINGGRDYYVEGFLYPNEEGKSIAELAATLEKVGSNRKIGFSIEGRALARDPFNPKKITKAVITGCAITLSAKNPNTWMSIVKGEYDEPFIEEQDGEDKDEVKTCPKCDHDQLINGTCLECGYKEKAMDTAAMKPAIPESVEHNPKDISGNFASNNNSTNFGSDLKKSEVFLHIAQRFPHTSIADQKTIYSLVDQVNSKIFKMEGTTITPEALQKAFSLLDEATALVKGEATPEGNSENKTEGDGTHGSDNLEKGEANSAIDFDSAEVQKAVDFATMLQKSVTDKQQGCDMMCKGGFSLEVAQASWEKALSATQAQQNGDTAPTTMEAPIVKSEEVTALVKSELDEALMPVNENFSKVNEAISKGFEGLNTIIKSMQEQNKALVEQNDLLSARLEHIEKLPLGRKSATSAAALERFSKSQDGGTSDENTYNVTSQDDLNRLSDRLMADHTEALEKGRQEEALMLEGTINAIEISKAVPEFAYRPLAAKGIRLVAPSRG